MHCSVTDVATFLTPVHRLSGILVDYELEKSKNGKNVTLKVTTFPFSFSKKMKNAIFPTRNPLFPSLSSFVSKISSCLFEMCHS
jgi:hypothetical protein